MSSQAERNLKDWTRLHRLPPAFPVLHRDDEPGLGDIYRREDGMEVRQLLDRIQGSPRTLIRFGAGQGTTTIRREMVRMAYHAAIRSMSLLVVLDPVADLDESMADDPNSLLPNALVRGMLKLLLEGRWEHRLYAERQAHLFATFGVPDEATLDDLRVVVEEAERKGERSTAFEAVVARYVDEPGQLVDGVHRNMNISTVVIFDVPSGSDDDIIRGMVRAAKWFDQNRPQSMYSAAFSEVYLMTRDHAEQMLSLWARDYDQLDFPAYSVGEVFAILATRFHPLLGRDAIPLNSILDQDFVRQAWDENLSLVEVTERLRTLMLERLDVAPSEVEYALKPSQPEHALKPSFPRRARVA